MTHDLNTRSPAASAGMHKWDATSWGVLFIAIGVAVLAGTRWSHWLLGTSPEPQQGPI